MFQLIPDAVKLATKITHHNYIYLEIWKDIFRIYKFKMINCISLRMLPKLYTVLAIFFYSKFETSDFFRL